MTAPAITWPGCPCPGLRSAQPPAGWWTFQPRAALWLSIAIRRTGRPDVDPLAGWNEIPGARGCTPQSCAFRDHHRDLQELGATVFGLSTQETDYQREAVERLHLPFELLSDAALEFATALRLPTFELAGKVFIKRLTLVTRDARIAKVFYPVFPPDQNADEVVRWLSRRIDGVSP